MAQIEDMAAARAGCVEVVEHLFRFAGNHVGAGKQRQWIDIALQGNAVLHAAAHVGQAGCPVQANRIAADGGNVFRPQRAALGEYDAGHALAVVFLGQSGNDALQIGQREFAIGAEGQHAAPGVENHHRLRTAGNLCVEIVDDCLRRHFQDVMQQIGPVEEHGLDGAKIAGSATFDHVAGQGEGAAGKADQGHRAIQGAADFGHGIHHIAQMVVGVRRDQLADFGFFAQRAFKFRPFAFDEIQSQSHGIGHGEYVGKQDGGIQLVACQRL